MLHFIQLKKELNLLKLRDTPLKEDLKDLMSNRPWMILFLMGLVTFIFLSLRIAVGLYYFQYYVGDESLFSMFAVLGTIGLIIGIPLSKPLTKKFGKRNTYIMSNALIWHCRTDSIFAITRGLYMGIWNISISWIF